jgi:hypothetical protein
MCCTILFWGTNFYCVCGAESLGTAFTYQGQLKENGTPIDDICDFEFSLWNAEVGPSQFGVTQIINNVTVTEGRFTVELNGAGEFSPNAFDGGKRFLEIAVKCPADNDFTTLVPRQTLNPAPYSLHASSTVFNVKNYGATGDGATDDLPAFEAALQAVPNTGGTIYIPPPTVSYKLAGTWEITEDNVQVIGSYHPQIDAPDDTTIHTVEITGDHVRIEGVHLKGNGTFDTDPADPRPALLFVHDVQGIKIIDTILTDPPSHAVRFEDVSTGWIERNTIKGGPDQYNGQEFGHQAVRLMNSSKIRVVNNIIRSSQDAGLGGVSPIGIFVGLMGSGVQSSIDGDLQVYPHDIVLEGNDITHVHDKGIYISTCVGCTVAHNTVKFSGKTGIVVGTVNRIDNRDAGNIVTGNTVINVLGDMSSGFHFRDAIYGTFTNNMVVGCAGGISVSSTSFSDVLLDYNLIKGNTVIGYTRNGISFGKGNMTVASASFNQILDNKITTETAAGPFDSVGSGITLGAIGGDPRREHNMIANNLIVSPPRHGIVVFGNSYASVMGNNIKNPGEAGTNEAPDAAGILVSQATQCKIHDNSVIDDGLDPNNMASGILGDVDTTHGEFYNNTVINSRIVSLRRLQLNDTNTFQGNRTAEDPLHDTFMLISGLPTTEVTNANINTGFGYTSNVLLVPLNSPAAMLMGSSAHLYVSDKTNGVSFTVATADGSLANGTEQFYYEIKQ